MERRRTPRLVLTRIDESDRADMDALHGDPRVMATLGGVRTGAELGALFDRFLREWRERGFGLWTMRDPRGDFVGRGGLRWNVTDDSGLEEVEVGWAVRADRWGLGLATELGAESLRAGFAVLGLDAIVAFTLPSNAASRRVMEKLGLRYEREGTRRGVPHVFYRITRPEWERSPLVAERDAHPPATPPAPGTTSPSRRGRSSGR
jgi:ribosomal-protein-alanine N-acetyltransferase